METWRYALKSALFWNHFEQSGSLESYLRFRQAIQDEAMPFSETKLQKADSAKRNPGKTKEMLKAR
jgi:hypothetical protein